MPAMVWVVCGLLGLRIIDRGEQTIEATVPWIVGGVALLYIMKTQGK